MIEVTTDLISKMTTVKISQDELAARQGLAKFIELLTDPNFLDQHKLTIEKMSLGERVLLGIE